jgi:hypothetical protein
MRAVFFLCGGFRPLKDRLTWAESFTAPLKNRSKLAKPLPLLAVAARLAAVWIGFFINIGGRKAHRHSLQSRLG